MTSIPSSAVPPSQPQTQSVRSVGATQDDLAPGLLPETPADRDERPQSAPIWRRLLRGRGALGLVLVGIVVVLGIAAPLLVSYQPDQQIDGAYLLGPSGSHLLGTDDVNRDVLTRVLYGIRVDLLVVVLAVPIGALIGSAIGLIGVSTSIGDVLTQRVFDVILAFPALILGIGLTAVRGPGAVTVGIIIAIAEIPVFGRLIRTAVLKVREQPYVEAARVAGASNSRILLKHVLPNSVEALGVQLALSLSLGVFIIGALSFLGIGIVAPTPSLGGILAVANGYLETNPWLAVGPLVVISALVLGFYLIAQAISDDRRRLR